MSIQLEHRYTAEEYLAIDRASDTKNEFLDGAIYAMGGATARHVQIAGNIGRELGNQLRDKPCFVYSSDLRVCVSPEGLYAYPDVVVACGEPVFIDIELDTLMNPLLIVEVLSDSTGNYDRGEKFERYRSIESFQEYLLIAQDKVHVERYTRQDDGTWLLSETNDMDDTIELSSVDCRLHVSEIYLKVSLANPPAARDAG